jgi:hypothetical protein
MLSTICVSQATQLPVRPVPPEHAAEYASAAQGEKGEPDFERIVVVRVGESDGACVRDRVGQCEEQS